ncbi:PREDICTED: 60S ribosomal protein L18a-like protein [Camelina sativa]|uniref:60S ribosomal protein L18a-like protein n=1 Tax=Camelina sativa TaxID=90675 RepID=A0ABM0W3Y9_CAMSA|nr:PREDICTED: 60S ribosomal protein L18a-like protein [Camelina sativa]
MTSGAVEDGKNRSVVTDHQHHNQQPPPPFQGVSNYQPPPQQQQPPAGGFPQPAQPYVQGYAVNGGMTTAEHHRLPCCGIGIGWVLFILGFFFGAIPWYIGFFLLLFSRNPRERPGYIACAIGSVVATIIIVIGAVRGSGVWS